MHTQLPSIVSDNNDQLNLKKKAVYKHTAMHFTIASDFFRLFSLLNPPNWLLTLIQSTQQRCGEFAFGKADFRSVLLDFR